MSVHYKTGGVWKAITALSANDSSTWKGVTDGWVKVSGVWKRFYGSDGYSFELTAGTGSGTTGYDTGVVAGTFGSIDAQPHPTADLAAFVVAGGAGVVWFVGDITADLAGKTVKVDSTEYTFDDEDWFFDSGYTQASWSSNGPPLSNMGVYDVDIT